MGPSVCFPELVCCISGLISGQAEAFGKGFVGAHGFIIRIGQDLQLVSVDEQISPARLGQAQLLGHTEGVVVAIDLTHPENMKIMVSGQIMDLDPLFHLHELGDDRLALHHGIDIVSPP